MFGMSIINCFCEKCNDDRDFVRVSKKETHIIRGEKIEIILPKLQCTTCFDLLNDPLFDDMKLLYDEYRYRHHWLKGEEIKAIRESLGLTCAEFAIKLNLHPATLARLEDGALQTNEQETLLRRYIKQGVC